MAVQAHHLLPIREVANAVESQQNCGAYMGLTAPYGPLCVPGLAARASLTESGVTFANAVEPPRNRARVETPVVGAAGLVQHVPQEVLDVDCLVLQNAEKMRAELAERRRRYTRQVVAAAEAAVAKRLRAKDEEIERMWRLNWAMEERLKTLCVEAQVWRDLAQSHQAAAVALRADLDQELLAQAHARLAYAGDAESCCCGENDIGGAGEEEVGSLGTRRGRCRGCGQGEAEVLLLPCRHLCACAPCAAAARACPACGCAKNGSVSVNLV